MFCASLTASSSSGACPALSVASGTSTSPENLEQTIFIFSCTTHLHVSDYSSLCFEFSLDEVSQGPKQDPGNLIHKYSFQAAPNGLNPTGISFGMTRSQHSPCGGAGELTLEVKSSLALSRQEFSWLVWPLLKYLRDPGSSSPWSSGYSSARWGCCFEGRTLESDMMHLRGGQIFSLSPFLEEKSMLSVAVHTCG